MSTTNNVDYDALANQARTQPATQPATPNYDALAAQARQGQPATHEDESFLSGLSAGFKTALNQTGETAMRAIGAVPVVGTALKSTPGWQQSMAQTQQIANEPVDTGGRIVGAGLENILEFAAGDEALKGLTTAAKIEQLARVEQALKKSPVIARMLGTAVRGQAVGTAQAGAHGATLPEALQQGALTAAGGAATEGVLGGGSKILDLIRPTTTDVLGETAPVLASQVPGASPMAESIAAIQREPQYAVAQQQAAATGIRNRAQQVAASELDRLNAARRTRWEQGEAVMNLAPEQQPTITPESRRVTTGAPQLPEATATGAPQLEGGTTPAEIMRPGAIGTYEGPTPQWPETPAAQPTATTTTPPRGQRVTFMEERPPNFEPIDVHDEVGNIRSFGDAADKIREHAAPIFDRLDRITNGQYTELRNLRDEAYAAEDYNGVRNAENAIDNLITNTRGRLDRADYKAAKSAWRTSKILDAVHDSVSRSFNISDESLAQEAGVWRGINGRTLQRGINRLTENYGRTALEDIIGQDGLTGLTRIASLTQSPQSAAMYGEKVAEVSHALAGGGRAGMIPSTIDWTRRMLLHQMAVNPRVARAVEFATTNRVAPSIYLPFINALAGGVVRDNEPPPSPEGAP